MSVDHDVPRVVVRRRIVAYQRESIACQNCLVKLQKLQNEWNRITRRDRDRERHRSDNGNRIGVFPVHRAAIKGKRIVAGVVNLHSVQLFRIAEKRVEINV